MNNTFPEEIELKSIVGIIKEKIFFLLSMILISFLISIFAASKFSSYETFIKLKKPSFAKFLKLYNLTLDNFDNYNQENAIKLAMQMQKSYFQNFERSFLSNSSFYDFMIKNYQSLFISDKYLETIQGLKNTTKAKKIYLFYNNKDLKLSLIYPDKFPGPTIIQKYILAISQKHEKKFIQDFRSILQNRKDTNVSKTSNENNEDFKNNRQIEIIENNLMKLENFNMDWNIIAEKSIYYKNHTFNKYLIIFYGTALGFTIGLATLIILWLYRMRLGKIE
tara:strand:+ start:2149 stop:2982 length:834 start_codon:yes stop_codon:yes gene_type:complete